MKHCPWRRRSQRRSSTATAVSYFDAVFVISLYAVSTKVNGGGGALAGRGAGAAAGGAPGAGASGRAALICSSDLPSFTMAAILFRRSVVAASFRNSNLSRNRSHARQLERYFSLRQTERHGSMKKTRDYNASRSTISATSRSDLAFF
jgi:hypothetical protein